MARLAKTAIDYPPMQDPASFNLEAVKKQIDETMKQHKVSNGSHGSGLGPPAPTGFNDGGHRKVLGRRALINRISATDKRL